MDHSIWMAMRYVSSYKRKSFIGFSSFASVIGIAFGVMVLIIVLSVMNGFQQEVRDRILKLTPHLRLSAPEPWTHWQPLFQSLSAEPEVLAVAPFLETQGLLKVQSRLQGVMIRAMAPEALESVLPLKDHMKEGSIEALYEDPFGIILGRPLAQVLGLGVGDSVLLLLPEVRVHMGSLLPLLRQLRVKGLFEVGYTHDLSMAFMRPEDLETLKHYPPKSISGLQVQLRDPFEAMSFRLEKEHTMPVVAGEWVSWADWSTENQSYFQAVRIEKTMMFLILLLIVGIAAFNLVATLVMMVTEKRADIAILKTLGASKKTIVRLFVGQGLILGFCGIGLGIILGLLGAFYISPIVAFIEKLFHWQLLSADLYYINFLPSRIEATDILRVGTSAFVLCVLATIYPSYRAARVAPAEALRYG